MSSLNVYQVEFCIKKPSAGGAGNANAYRRDPRKALVSAASSHPKDLLAVLNLDVTLLAGEVIEILAVHQLVAGTEGAAVLA